MKDVTILIKGKVWRQKREENRWRKGWRGVPEEADRTEPRAASQKPATERTKLSIYGHEKKGMTVVGIQLSGYVEGPEVERPTKTL